MADEPDGTTTFILCRLRLELALAAAAGSTVLWPRRIAVAIRAALELFEADRDLGRELTAPAASGKRGPARQFSALVDHLATLWLRGAPPLADPERAARTNVRRIARQVLLQLETRPRSPVTEIGPDLIVFVLTPYIGLAEARRFADSDEASASGP